MHPSHLFRQGIDPVAAIEHLGELVLHAAAKDTRINEHRAIHGVLDDRHTLNRWPTDSSWDFVAVGRGHDHDFWTCFLQALSKINPDMAVNIEHEDLEPSQLEGLQVAANNLTAAAS